MEEADLEEIMSEEALIYELSVVLMRLDGNEGDPHQLVWCGGAIPEPWGDVWQKYEPQAKGVLNAIGEFSARAMVDALGDHNRCPSPESLSTPAVIGGRDTNGVEGRKP